MPGVRSLFYAGSGSKEDERFSVSHRISRSRGRAPGSACVATNVGPGLAFASVHGSLYVSSPKNHARPVGEGYGQGVLCLNAVLRAAALLSADRP